jgi:hypothetical protein|tara:strand:+ start:464 stop:958 length:495 start_codon:yes stop_codon:yes gene_type:complete
MASKGKPMSKVFKTGPVPVVFQNLASLDTQFDKQGNHNITVSVDGAFRAILSKIKTEFGKTRELSGNKIHDKYGEQQTFKSTLYRDKTIFPEIWNGKQERIVEVPNFGDIVNVRFVAKQTDVNGKKYISMYLDAVQFLENNSGNDCPFDRTEPEVEEEQEDLPF